MVVPSRRMALAMLIPLVLATVTLADEGMFWPMIAADLAIVAVAGLDVLLGRRRLVAVERRCRNVFSVGRPNQVVLELRSLSRRRMKVRVTDDVFEHATSPELPTTVDLPARGRVSVQYSVVPTRRGAYELGDHHVRYATPLGLWERQVRVEARDTVRIYPDVDAVSAFELLAKQNRQYALVRATRRRGGENEFEALREYQRDDEFRSIDWKATARRGRHIARQYQLEQNQSVVFALDCGRQMTAEQGGLSLFDHALNSSLMMAHIAARGGDHVGLFAFTDQVVRFIAPTGGRRIATRLVQAVFDVHPQLVESDYERAFSQVGHRMRKRSLVVIFTQVIDDHAATELLRVTRSLLPRHLPLCVLLRDPEVEALAVRPGRGAVDMYVTAAAAELLSWRDRVIRDLKKAGAMVLDVEPGDLTPQIINQYLEIKARHLL